MNRVFFLTNHACVGESGGGHGVEFRLYQADQKYHLFDAETIYIFGDRAFRGCEEPGKFSENKDLPQRSPIRLKIRKYIPSIFRLAKLHKANREIGKYLSKLNERFNFSDDDIFVLHDVKIAKVFVEQFKFTKCALVYHKQGSIYQEWHADTGLNSRLMKSYYNKAFKEIVSSVKYLCFPSKGAEESLVASAPELEEIEGSANRKYLYNGVFCPDIDLKELPKWISEINDFNGYKFITVANLNEAKAVERIPSYIGSLIRAGLSAKWILIGNGVMADSVKKAIEINGIQEHVIWRQDSISHQDVMRLFSITDFYILFHKYSIFDLSTLEAMHYGNIPILTPVGGNKEVILDQNGLFVSNFEDTSSFMQLIQQNSIEEMKEKNKNIKREHFDDKAFLTRYVSLCKLLDSNASE